MLALIALVQLDVTLTAIAIGVSFRARTRAATFGATAVSAAATGLAALLAWMAWFVAPACLVDPNVVACTAGRVGVNGFVYVSEIALLEWAWMLGVSLIARFVVERRLARVSG